MSLIHQKRNYYIITTKFQLPTIVLLIVFHKLKILLIYYVKIDLDHDRIPDNLRLYNKFTQYACSN